ncbi:MAG TPA: 50S ribosomal protein L25/general stress protein Ctc [Gemmatimonadaceae bacterium]|jgi:large subunit ribosomal protein L25|nr:50S ribosomal protein L25/general stress protein Ctc [Gemmatimonadaceae bacterium]
MASATLNATPRTDTGKGVARTLRRNGQVPAVIYGHAREAQPLAVSARELDRLLQNIAAESTVVELSLDGKTSRTLIREIQRHPFKRMIMHVDFQELVAGETVIVRIPLVIVGTPEAVRSGGGVLDQTMRELEIEVDPANMPNHIDVDVSELALGHSVHVRDIKVPAGAKVLDDEDASIATVQVSRAGVEAAATTEGAEGAEAEAPEPEVIRKAKAEDEE